MLLSIAPQARGSAVFPLWCPASVCVSMDSSLGMSHTLLRGVCVCACVFHPTAASMASLHAALCTPLLSVDLRICLSLPVLVLPCLSRPLPSSLALPLPPPLSSTSSSSSSSLAPPHTGCLRFFLFSLRGVYPHFPTTASSPQMPPSLSLSLSLSRCLIFVLCVNQASLTLTPCFPPLSLLYLILFPFPCFHLQLAPFSFFFILTVPSLSPGFFSLPYLSLSLSLFPPR